MTDERDALEEILAYCMGQFNSEQECWECAHDHWSRHAMRIYGQIIIRCAKALGKDLPRKWRYL